MKSPSLRGATFGASSPPSSARYALTSPNPVSRSSPLQFCAQHDHECQRIVEIKEVCLMCFSFYNFGDMMLLRSRSSTTTRMGSPLPPQSCGIPIPIGSAAPETNYRKNHPFASSSSSRRLSQDNVTRKSRQLLRTFSPKRKNLRMLNVFAHVVLRL